MIQRMKTYSVKYWRLCTANGIGTNSCVYLFLSFIFSVLLPLSVTGQKYIYDFSHFTQDEGLAGNTIYSMAQDTLGYAWIGTNNGVSRYNGYTFENLYAPNDSCSENWTISKIVVDNQNNVLIGTQDNGLWLYDSFQKQLTRISNSLLPFNRVYDICMDKSGAAYIATDMGLFLIFKDNHSNKYSVGISGVDKIINEPLFARTLFIDSKSNLWVGSRNGKIVRYSQKAKRKKIKVYSAESGNEFDSEIMDIQEDKQGRLYAGTWGNGVVVLDRTSDTWKSIYKNCDFTLDPFPSIVTNILLASSGNLYFATWGFGVFEVTPDVGSVNHWTYSPRNPEGLNYNSIWSLMEDKEGNIWIGTDYEGGVNIYDISGSQLKHIELPFTENNALNSSNSFAFGRDNSIFVGGAFGLCRLNRNKLVDKNCNGFVHGIGEVTQVASFGDSSTLVIANAKNECYIINPESGNMEHLGIKGAVKKIMYNEIDGNVWILASSGLYSLNQNSSLLKKRTKNLAINDFDIDVIGNCWLATSNYGLVEYRDFTGEFNSYQTEVSTEFVELVHCDSHGNVYFFNSYRGLMRLDVHSGLTYRSKSSRFPLVNVQNIFSHQNGTVWVTTDKAIFKISFSNSEILYEKVFDDIKGCFFSKNSAIINPSGTAIIGASNGFYSFNTELVNDNFGYKKTILTNVLVNNESVGHLISGVEHLENLELEYSENSISFMFSAMKHTASNDYKYAYILLGFENRLQYTTGRNHSATYTNLPAGDYLFKVAAVDSSGAHEFREVNVHIKKPFWQMKWFLLLCCSLVMIFATKIVKYREMRMIDINLELQREIDNRTSEIAKQHKKLQEKNSELEAQSSLLEEKLKEKRQKQHEIKLQKRSLEQQNYSIEFQHRSIVNNIKYAKKIQDMVLQPSSELYEVFPNSFLIYRPRDLVGGDFFWVHQWKNKKMIAVADCTGHGVPGAFMSILGFSLLKDVAAKNINSSAAGILELLKSKLNKALSNSNSPIETKDGMDMGLCIVDTELKQINYAGANNPLIYVTKNRLHTISASKQPVGVFYKDEPFKDEYLTYSTNDSIYLFSDGYPDQFGGERNKKFKSGMFKKLLLEVAQLPPKGQEHILNNTLDKWIALLPENVQKEQTDDIIVVGIKL